MPPFVAVCCSVTLHDCLLQCRPSWLSIVVLQSQFCPCYSATITSLVCCSATVISPSCLLQCYRNQSNQACMCCYVTIMSPVSYNATIFNPVFCGAFLPCLSTASVQFSSVPRPIGSSEGHEGRFSRDPLPVFSAGGPYEQFWHGQMSTL